MTDISLEQLLENIVIFDEDTADQFPNAQVFSGRYNRSYTLFEGCDR